MVDSMTERAPDPRKPAEALAAVVAMRRFADQLALAAVENAIRQGWTWAQIGEALGVSAQAAHKRYSRQITREMNDAETKPNRRH